MAAANWPACIAFTLEQEGGLVDDPNDPGGLTNFGISQAAYPDVDIRALTRPDAESIYHRDYWATIAGDTLTGGVDLMVFDMAVNAGVGLSARLLQQCIGVGQDGAIGPETLAALGKHDPAQVIAALFDAQMAYYHNLANWDRYGDGWGARVQRREAAARGMIA